MAKDGDEGSKETWQRDLGNLLALIEYAKAEALRLRIPTAPALLAAAMEDIEEALVASLGPAPDPETRQAAKARKAHKAEVIRLADRASFKRRRRGKFIN